MPRAFTFRRMPLLPLIGLLVALLAVAAATGLTVSERLANRWVAHTMRMQLAIADLQDQTAQYEAGYRGYITRPLPNFLVDTTAARSGIGRAMARLRRETADSPAQRARLDRLAPLVARKLAVGSYWVDAVRRGDVATAMVRMRPGAGREIGVQIRRETDAMMAVEADLLARRNATSERMSLLLASGLAATVVLVVVTALLTVNDAGKRFAVMEEALDDAIEARDATGREAERREQAEAQLRQVQKMESIGQLTGGIAHDFNNMLAVVIGGLDLARRRMADDPARALRSIGIAEEGTQRAAALVARLLAFARRQPLAPTTVDVNRLVGGMLGLLRRTLGEEVTIETHLADDAWCGLVDPGQLENAVLNLAVNARDAMAGRPQVRLVLATDNARLDGDPDGAFADVAPGDYVRLSVTDTGTGMDETVLRKAFEPFFTTKPAGRGTGMGLSQVFGFVKQSHGHVAIESRVGEGTTIRLYLPRHDGQEEAPPVAASDAVPRGSAGEVVLVVEDEPRVRAYSIEALEELGYGVLSAADGEAALIVLRAHAEVTVLFTDMVMPGMSGRMLAETARAERPALRILFTTGYAQDAVAAGWAPGPGAGLLTKPFTIRQLAMRLRDVIEG